MDKNSLGKGLTCFSLVAMSLTVCSGTSQEAGKAYRVQDSIISSKILCDLTLNDILHPNHLLTQKRDLSHVLTLNDILKDQSARDSIAHKYEKK